MNHGNLLVGADGTVVLIDCDSFQIGNGTNVFTCDVGVPLFTAPGFTGARFAGLFGPRIMTASASPSSCFISFTWAGIRLPVDMSALATCRLRKRSVSTASPTVQTALRTAWSVHGHDSFGDDGRRHRAAFHPAFGRADNSGIRPDAKTWVEALEKLKLGLQVCSQASWHHYPGGLAACPWCAVESGWRAPVRATDCGSRPNESNRSCHDLESNLGDSRPGADPAASF